MVKADTDVRVVAQLDTEGNLTTAVSATPGELLAVIQHLVSTFSEAAGISYDEVLDDLKELDTDKEV
jgi:hypothetical protein